jgi:hypothetical protein
MEEVKDEEVVVSHAMVAKANMLHWCMDKQ